MELFPEDVTRLEPAALAELAGQLCHFDQASAARSPEFYIGALTQSVLARYSAASQPRSSSPGDSQASR